MTGVSAEREARGSAGALVVLALLMIAAGVAAFALPYDSFSEGSSERLERRLDAECPGVASVARDLCSDKVTDEERRASLIRRSPFLLLSIGGVALLVTTGFTLFNESELTKVSRRSTR